MTVLQQHIPAELKALDQWVVWRYERGTKVPYCTSTSKRASSTNPATWCSFMAAVEAVLASDRYAGVGFVFQEDDPYTGVDLDDCINDAGDVATWALEILTTMDSYSEVSPSGKGIKIWVRGTIPTSVKRGPIELYNKGRYFTVTGNLLPDSPSAIREVNGELDSLYDSLKKSPTRSTPPLPRTQPVSDTAALENWRKRTFDTAIDMVASAPEGSRHDARLKAARLLGGLIPHGLATADEIETVLYDAQPPVGNHQGELKTIRDGIAIGSQTPLEIPAEFPIYPSSPAPVFGQGSPQTVQAPAVPIATTWPYLIEHGRIMYCSERPGLFGPTIHKSVVAELVARITEEHVAEDGSKTFLITGETATGMPLEISIDAERFSDTRQLKAVLVAAAGARAPIYAGMEKHLAPAIQRLSEDMPRIRRFTRTGWTGGHFLIPGRVLPDIAIHLNRKLPYGFDPKAKLSEGLEALESLILAMGAEKATPAISVAFLAPLAALAGWRNERCALFISGRTGSLKSSWTQTLMALYGPNFMRDELLIKWGEGATRNAIMAMAASVYDLPLLIDNYKPNTGGGPRDFVNLIHNILEGGEKDRLNRASELRDTKPVFSWPVVTGEDVPDTDPASLARVLVVQFAWQRGEENLDLSKAQQYAEHLCAVGQSWIEWLETDEGRRAAELAGRKFEEARRMWSNDLRAMRPDMVNILRVASNLATNELTWSVMMEHPELGELAKRYERDHMTGLEEIATAMAHYTAEALEASRFITGLREVLATGQAMLLGRNETPNHEADKDRMIGWRDENGIYLLPSIARTKVERFLGKDGLNNISEKTLYTQMQNLGYIVSSEQGRSTKLFRAGTGVHRVLHLPPDILGDTSGPVVMPSGFPTKV